MSDDKMGFSLGAFMFGPLFMGAHKCYGMMILSFILLPFLGIIWMIVCGVKGAEWAYHSSDLDDAGFSGSMETWNRAGMISLVLSVISIILLAAIAIPGFLLYQSTSNQMNDPYPNNSQTIEWQADE